MPEVMFGEVPAAIYEQNIATAGIAGVDHHRGEAQILTAHKGRLKVTVDNSAFVLKPGQALFVNCNRMLNISADHEGPCYCLSLLFNPQVIGAGGGYGLYSRYVEPIIHTSAPGAVLLDEDASRTAGQVLCGIGALWEERPLGMELEIVRELISLWVEVLRCAQAGECAVEGISYSEKVRIYEMCEFIHRNYAEKITLHDIADAAHVSKGECCRIFKRVYRATPFQYLVNYRLNRSIQLLTETDYSIAQIAQHVGFCSSSYYTKCFRKVFQCVPHKYRAYPREKL